LWTRNAQAGVVNYDVPGFEAWIETTRQACNEQSIVAGSSQVRLERLDQALGPDARLDQAHRSRPDESLREAELPAGLDYALRYQSCACTKHAARRSDNQGSSQ